MKGEFFYGKNKKDTGSFMAGADTGRIDRYWGVLWRSAGIERLGGERLGRGGECLCSGGSAVWNVGVSGCPCDGAPHTLESSVVRGGDGGCFYGRACDRRGCLLGRRIAFGTGVCSDGLCALRSSDGFSPATETRQAGVPLKWGTVPCENQQKLIFANAAVRECGFWREWWGRGGEEADVVAKRGE